MQLFKYFKKNIFVRKLPGMARYENPIEHACDMLEGQVWILQQTLSRT